MAETVQEAAAQVEIAAKIEAEKKLGDVIEASNEAIAEAEAAAQLVTDAAIRNELGRRVENVEKELEQCRTQNLSLQATIQAMEARLSELAALMLTLQSPIVEAPKVISIPQASETEPETLPGVVIPAEIQPSADADAPEKPGRPRRRLL
jgi:chromosome segregation ATPase